METRDHLAYWLADRCDQLAFLTMGGISYAYRPDGSRRPSSDGPRSQKLQELAFADDIEAPSEHRHVRWDATTATLKDGDTTAVAADDALSYRTIVRLKEFARNNYVKGLRMKGKEYFVMFVTPSQMADLKLDPDFLANARQAQVRGASNMLWTGDEMFHHRRMPAVRPPARPERGQRHRPAWWPMRATPATNGERTPRSTAGGLLFCGQQALVMADLDMGSDAWVERDFDYGAEPGIAIAKIFGFRKPRFSPAPYYPNGAGDDEDFGVISVDTAQSVSLIP